MPVREVLEDRERGSQGGQRERQDTLDLCRIDRDGCHGHIQPEQLLSDHPAE